MSADFDKRVLDLLVTHCWGAIYGKADRTERHNRFPADLSCVVDLEAEEGCAPRLSSGDTAYPPRPPILVLFPGIAMNEVPVTPGRRVGVAMNLFKPLAG